MNIPTSNSAAVPYLQIVPLGKEPCTAFIVPLGKEPCTAFIVPLGKELPTS